MYFLEIALLNTKVQTKKPPSQQSKYSMPSDYSQTNTLRSPVLSSTADDTLLSNHSESMLLLWSTMAAPDLLIVLSETIHDHPENDILTISSALCRESLLQLQFPQAALKSHPTMLLSFLSYSSPYTHYLKQLFSTLLRCRLILRFPVSSAIPVLRQSHYTAWNLPSLPTPHLSWHPLFPWLPHCRARCPRP